MTISYDEHLQTLNETPVSDLDLPTDVEIPAWVAQDTTPYTIASIAHGGCASGAYMPACYHHQAAETMAEHGDAVLDFLDDAGVTPSISLENCPWSGLACKILACAVDVWAGGVEDTLATEIEELAHEAAEETEETA